MVTEFAPLFLMVVLAAGLALTLLKLAEWLGPARPATSSPARTSPAWTPSAPPETATRSSSTSSA